jgi:hypothetical protein
MGQEYPMPKFTPETPEQFLVLPVAKRIDRVVKMYLVKCTEVKLYKYNPKLKRNSICSDYGQLKNFFKKNDSDLVLLYSYLYGLQEEPKEFMSLTEVYLRASAYNQRMKLESDREKTKDVTVENYEDYETILKGLMES